MGAAKLKQEMVYVDRKEMGRADTLRYNVISYVVEESYDRAISELKAFLEKDSEFARFRDRAERFVFHAVDLVNAIKAKKNMPGMHNLTVAKQQEINEKIAGHFQELQYVLKKIEKIQYDLKIDDIRSTVYVVRALAVAVFVVVVVAFVVEANHGLATNLIDVVDDGFIRMTDWFFKLIKF